MNMESMYKKDFQVKSLQDVVHVWYTPAAVSQKQAPTYKFKVCAHQFIWKKTCSLKFDFYDTLNEALFKIHATVVMQSLTKLNVRCLSMVIL